MTGEREVIGLFPLAQVLLPGMPLPLRVFEPRYRQLLRDVQAAPSAGFGVTALHSGSEVATAPGLPADEGPDIASVGTYAEIVEAVEQDDGTVRVLAVGSRRFAVCSVLPSTTPYLQAEIEWLDEPEGLVPPGAVEATRRLCEQLGDLIAGLTGQRVEAGPLRDPTMLSYRVAAEVPLAPADRLALLVADTAADRLVLANRLLRREIRLVQTTRSIAMAPAVLQLAADPN